MLSSFCRPKFWSDFNIFRRISAVLQRYINLQLMYKYTIAARGSTPRPNVHSAKQAAVCLFLNIHYCLVLRHRVIWCVRSSFLRNTASLSSGSNCSGDWGRIFFRPLGLQILSRLENLRTVHERLSKRWQLISFLSDVCLISNNSSITPTSISNQIVPSSRILFLHFRTKKTGSS
jgi:hypothetical protein